jgi:hypothetical protein
MVGSMLLAIFIAKNPQLQNFRQHLVHQRIRITSLGAEQDEQAVLDGAHGLAINGNARLLDALEDSLHALELILEC